MRCQNYHVVMADTINRLEEKVRELIEQGWQPTGGVISRTGVYIAEFYMQTMWRPRPSNEPL